MLQLPPNLQCNVEALAETLGQFPNHVRVAVEFRHDSWFVDDVRKLLEAHDAAFCLADKSGMLGPAWRTADWGYVRFHEGKASPHPCYGRAALHTWAERIAELWSGNEDVFVYFNNDTNVCAPRDAGVFARECKKAGLECTRHPNPAGVAVG